MTFKDWDECLKFLVVLTKWPPIVLLIVLLFRSAIAKKLADLKQITIKEKADIVFDTLKTLKNAAAKTSPALFQQLVLKLPSAAITDGEAETDDVKDKDEKEEDDQEPQDVDVDEDKEPAEAERAELAKQLKALVDKSDKDE